MIDYKNLKSELKFTFKMTDEEVDIVIVNCRKALKRLAEDNGCDTIGELFRNIRDYTGDTADEYWMINEEAFTEKAIYKCYDAWDNHLSAFYRG